MRKNVVELEGYSLAESSRDETDQRRRSITLTSKGWLVHFARKTELIGQPALRNRLNGRWRLAIDGVPMRNATLNLF
ncbi:MAG: hypothetical protein GEU93_06035 [Propionibacteriales bacterium]|nr:hypothetical protein [Propionibacteriales bacterium]